MTPTHKSQIDRAIEDWQDGAEWKPAQRLCAIGERMCFPVEAILNGQKIEDGKDYILRDVVEAALRALVEAESADVEAIGKAWVAVWNKRLNPPLSHEDLDKFGAFLDWLNKEGYLTTNPGVERK